MAILVTIDGAADRSSSAPTCVLLVGPWLRPSFGGNVPVRGSGSTDDGCSGGLITVLVKFAVPLPPVPLFGEPTRFILAPLNDQVDVRSPTHVWAMLNLTSMDDHCVSRDTGYGDRADDTEFVIIGEWSLVYLK